MNRINRPPSGVTVLEIVVVIVIILLLIGLVVPATFRTSQADTIVALSNMRQLHAQSLQMALDGYRTHDDSLGWPGDTGGSFSNWATHLVNCGYISSNDLCQLLSARGRLVPTDHLPTANTTAILVYSVSTNSPSGTVFLSTANFTNTPDGGVLNPGVKPYGRKRFAVLTMQGSASTLTADQTGHANLIGPSAPLCR